MKPHKLLWFGLGLFALAIVLTGILPFCFPKSVSKEVADSVSVPDFYGNAPCTDRVALVESPVEGFLTRIHILDEAVERIDVSYYAMHMSDSTDLFLGALLDAADRGVQVRILVDGQFGGLTHSHRAYASAIGSHPNMELKLYNPPNLLKPWTWNGRLHDKYILIDDRLLLLGGRNIGDKYFAENGDGKVLSYDRDVLVYNTGLSQETVLHDVRAYMDGIWDGENVAAPFSRATKLGTRKQQALREAFCQFRQENERLFDHGSDDYEGWTCAANRVTFFHNDTCIGPKQPTAGYLLGQLLRSAEHRVTLQSPYVILDQHLQSLLEDLGQMDIDAKILTNSLAASPNPMACTAYSGDRKTILATGISVWEYQMPNTLHAKSYLIDDRMSVVGSFNLDPRSDTIDTELMLAIDSQDFAQHLGQVLDAYQANALQVGPDGQYLPGQKTPEVPVPFSKKLMVWVLTPIVRLLKGLT